MMRISLLLIVSGLAALALAGCSGNVSKAQGMLETEQQSAIAVPVFIIPNCQTQGRQSYCQWIEPRGYKPYAPASTNSRRVNGIAL